MPISTRRSTSGTLRRHTGLACSLLEIRHLSQLDTHYLRGGLFENLVINEFLKRDYNRGLEPSLSFRRDSTGHEVDLLRRKADRTEAYEIKAGATFPKSYFAGLDYWGRLSDTGPEDRTVIYGGDLSMQTSFGNLGGTVRLLQLQTDCPK